MLLAVLVPLDVPWVPQTPFVLLHHLVRGFRVFRVLQVLHSFLESPDLLPDREILFFQIFQVVLRILLGLLVQHFLVCQFVQVVPYHPLLPSFLVHLVLLPDLDYLAVPLFLFLHGVPLLHLLLLFQLYQADLDVPSLLVHHFDHLLRLCLDHPLVLALPSHRVFLVYRDLRLVQLLLVVDLWVLSHLGVPYFLFLLGCPRNRHCYIYMYTNWKPYDHFVVC